MSETEKFITLHAGFGSYGERVTDFTVMPKQEAQYAIQPLASMCIDQVRAYGPRGSKPRIVSVSLPEAEPITDVAADDVQVVRRLEVHQRTVETGGLIVACVRNDGDEPAKFSVVASGTCKDDDDSLSETLCALTRTPSPSKPTRFTLRRGEAMHNNTLLPHTARLLRVRIEADAPEGAITVSALQLANCNLLLGDSVPIEAFAGRGASMRSRVCGPGTRLTFIAGCSNDAPDGPMFFSVEYDITARGVALQPARAR
jgi:hypothetical protein